MAADDRDTFRTVEYWDRLVLSDPEAALLAASSAAETFADDSTVRALASGAQARAHHDLGQLDEARRAARRGAIELRRGVADEARWATAMSIAAILAESGDFDDGLRVIDPLVTESGGVHRGRAEIQRAYILSQAGRLNEALLALEAADRELRDRGEQRDLFRLHQNRGLVLLQQGRLDEADDDFRAAERVGRASGLHAMSAFAVASRAVTSGRARRIADSLELFRVATQMFEEAGNPARMVAVMEIDRAEVMMHSGLLLDAVEAARRASHLVAPTGNRVQIGDAQLLLARTELEAGQYRAALASADAAASTFRESGRREMVGHATSIGAIAALRRARTRDDARAALVATVDVAAELRSDGWHQQADEFLMTRVRVADAHGLLEHVGPSLEHLRLGAWSSQRDLALIGWYAEAMARRRAGDLDGAFDAIRAGFAPLDEIIAEADTLERRSAVMRLGGDLGQFAIDCAVEVGDAHIVWAAAEGTRARALHDELFAGTRHRGLDDDDARRLAAELVARLGKRTLVEWVVSGSRVHAVVLNTDGLRLVDVASVAEVSRLRDRVLMWLDVAASEPDESSARAITAARTLDELLVAPLGLPDDGGIVLVPVGLLHGIPWAALPSLTTRPFALSPNAQVWLEADRRSAGGALGDTVGCVIGPDVAGAAVERAAIESSYRDASFVADADALAASVASIFADCDVLHLAAHGRFRSDRPLLSTLQLADGEATLSDTVPDRVGSRIVVLSSCEGGASGVADGSEVLGLAAVLLARGASSVLAPLTAVRDLECADFVAEVHRELSAGLAIADAVGAVRRRWLAASDLSRWAVASSFLCFGSGASRVRTGQEHRGATAD